ncbi:MAG: class II aldolase/adducin family protein [Opitutaceae bacterium]
MTALATTQLALREQIIAACRRLGELGLNQGTSGNISVRVSEEPGDGFLLTPASLDYEVMHPDDLVHIAPDGTCNGSRRPSSELPFHLAIMRARSDARAIVHTHSTQATAVSCLRRRIPALHYLVALFGGSDIRCADYATFGTEELSANIVRALTGRRAALLANHGLVVIGESLAHALSLTVEAEQLAKLYLATLAAGVPPVILDEQEIAAVAERFRAYGYRPVE